MGNYGVLWFVSCLMGSLTDVLAPWILKAIVSIILSNFGPHHSSYGVGVEILMFIVGFYDWVLTENQQES